MKYIYTIVGVGLLIIIWFAPIDIGREKELANTGLKMIVVYILENTWLKIALSILLGLMLVGLHKRDKENSD